ncbi:MAG TPA: histidine kinase N-terminal domain-containing protein [Bacillales bacterium]|nr:histidine kinase N-terminal domain-containing protein [Bacillales bacterium]
MKPEELDRFIAYLETHFEEIIQQWLSEIEMNEEDPFFLQVVGSGKKTMRMIVAYLRRPNHQYFERVTRKIVRERIEANSDLHEIVSSINFGRKIVSERICEAPLPDKAKTEVLLDISCFFDIFLYHSVIAFKEQKEKIIHEKNRFIQQMHADRLTILGQIAASFAHEFRNPLTAIKGFMTLLKKRHQEDEKSMRFLKVMEREMECLQDKVTGFLYLSKREGLDDRKESVDLKQLLDDALELLSPRLLDAGISVERAMPEEEVSIQGTAEQIKQVFLNILNNAVEELCETEGRKQIEINLFANDLRATVCFANNGNKIEPHLLDDIFEPFISTKELGTGLGLAVCKQIIEKHGGRIFVQSNADRTSFCVQFPRR